MKQESITPKFEQSNNSTRRTTGKSIVLKTHAYPVVLKNFVRTFLVCAAFWLVPSLAKADTPIPTSVVSTYNAATQRLTLTVQWTWGSNSNSKLISVAVFANLNGDVISPTFLDNPATYNSGGNPFPAGLTARDEFLGQIANSSIEGTASSSMYPGGDRTDNGIAFQNGFGPNDPRVLFPYGTIGAGTVGNSGTFTLTYDNVTVTPTKICVVMYDVHTGDLDKLSGNHSPRSANPGHNGDNSVEDGNGQGTVSCSGLVDLRCAINKTETACQNQAAIDASYNTWLNSVTASGCNGVLTNNSTGAPPASGGSRTVTWTYTQNSCPNQAPVTTCTATFTVPPCPARDLAPTITAFPNIMDGPTDFGVTVKTTELLGNPTDGSQIKVTVPKDPKVTFVWQQNATEIGPNNAPVNNLVWTYDGTNAFDHIFTTNIVIGANGHSTFGFNAHFNPGQTRGNYPLTASLNSGSGGENNFGNNNDSESIDFFF